jgi:hypothetical protein
VLCHVQERPEITPGGTRRSPEFDTRGCLQGHRQTRSEELDRARPGDSRVQLLSLTRRGSRVLPQLVEIADQNDREFFDGLETDERATRRRLLGKLAEFRQIREVLIE